ncbi:sugar ABC transporter ATP-binding protein [Thermogemmatispora sp.]|uniref:sugar ABC transporter ATP-binding protein n=1 Tax=Thermogemmatispora sp. TaxID=1968838 RepID=UPI0035E4186F
MSEQKPLLEARGIEKSFFGVKVLHKISFSLSEGQVLGVIGENGAGKSTLMNILGGVVQADAGELLLAGEPFAPRTPRDAMQQGIAFIHQELNLFTNLTITENIFINGFPRLPFFPVLIDGRKARSQVRKLLSLVDLKVSPDTLVERLSPGERQLVEIARALNSDARVIIFDEPTTSLTARETERLFTLLERLKAQGKAIIYISHILEEVERLCDKVLILRDGEQVCTACRGELKIPEMISLMVGRTLEQLYPPRSSRPTSETVLEVRGLSQSGIVADINFALHRGEVLGLFGLMGSGRTELARMIFGLDPFERGEILLRGKPLVRHSPSGSIRQGLGFVTENRREEGLLMEISVTENMALVSLPRYTRSLLRLIDRVRLYKAVDNLVRLLQIRGGLAERTPVKSLSGGNQQKVVIGKWLLAQPAVLILDEPTRGVDVGARYELYTLINELAAQGTAILMISSEIEELIGMCDRILVMGNGEILASFERDEFDQERILRSAFREKVLS